jgi:Spy/CpxP family protein refolding chaperone
LQRRRYFAGDKAGCCAMGGEGKMAKEGCEMTFASLNLTAEQKTKMEKVAADCHKAGCTEDSMANMNKQAEQILSKSSTRPGKRRIRRTRLRKRSRADFDDWPRGSARQLGG